MRTSSLLICSCLTLTVSRSFAAPSAAATPAAKAAKAAPAKAPAATPVPPPPTKAAPGAAKAPAVDPAVASLERFGQAIQRVTLDNGLRVVMNVEHAAPTVAVSVTYAVGSSAEVVGRTGFAHLFEHMMFQGSKHAGKGEHFKLVSDRGGSLNGTTSSDRTNYFEVLPSSELELALWLESDRMRWLAVTPENFDNQREVVKEELRMRIDNQAYMPGRLQLGELVYQGFAPYAHPTIGSIKDLDAATFDWVKAFHDQNYAADNAVLTIAGDFDADQAMAWVQKYFGPAEARHAPPLLMPPMPDKPPSTKASVEDVNARTPAFIYGYMIPAARTPEHYALDLASVILADGESSRLYKALVHDQAVAESVSADTEDHRGPDQFTVMAVLTEKGSLAKVEASVDQALATLRSTPPSAAELDKAKRRLRSAFVFGLQTNMGRATRLGEYEALFGDARLLARELPRYLAITPEAVRDAAAKYLTPERRSIVEVVPSAKGGKP